MSAPLSTATPAEILGALKELNQPAYRADQIRRAVWQPYVDSFARIKQLPASLQQQLDDRFQFSTIKNVVASEADNGETIKLLCTFHDGQSVETVAMESPARGRKHRRATVCVSSQVGCAVGCPFCATGMMGLRRNCTAAEILDQVRAAGNALYRQGFGGVTHIVFMGMGEPLLNADTVLQAISHLSSDAGISLRRITVSTSGIIPGIKKLQEADLPVTLAISLHATTKELRDKLVPINRKYPLAELLDAASAYAQGTGRRITFEWCLIGGVNDSVAEAKRLAQIARDLRAHINVIPMNHVEGSPWGPPSEAQTQKFLAELSTANMTVRDTRGNQADAACGQLRANLEPVRLMRNLRGRTDAAGAENQLGHLAALTDGDRV